MTAEHEKILREYAAFIKKTSNRSRLLRIKDFLNYCEENGKTCAGAASGDVLTYRDCLSDMQNEDGSRRYNKETVIGIICRIGLFYRYLIETGEVKVSPVEEYYKKMRREKSGKKPRDVGPEEEELLRRYEKRLEMKGAKKRGIEMKLWNVERFLKYLRENNLSMFHLTCRDAEEYREYLRLTPYDGKNEYSPLTINNALGCVQNFYCHLTCEGVLPHNPFRDVKRMRGSNKLPRNVARIDEMGEILSKIELTGKSNFELKTVLELLYSTGARINEIEKLTKKDVNLNEGYITIYDDKERQDRRSPLTEVCREYLRMYMEHFCRDRDVLFDHGKARSLNRWVNDKLKILAQKNDLPLVTCHGIRHMIASHMAKKGADLRQIQEYLGHRRIKTTEKYTHIFPEDLKEIVEKSHPRENF